MNASLDPDDAVFADLRIAFLERQAADGAPVDQSEIDRLREIHLARDPVCWSWPAPVTCAFADEEAAGRFLKWWNRDCAICGDVGGLVEDHDHKTSFVRGYLCRSCNVQEGKSDDLVYQKYRDRNPAGILGVQVRYWSAWTGYAEPDRTEEEKFDNRAIAAYVLGERFDRGVASLPREG